MTLCDPLSSQWEAGNPQILIQNWISFYWSKNSNQIHSFLQMKNAILLKYKSYTLWSINDLRFLIYRSRLFPKKLNIYHPPSCVNFSSLVKVNGLNSSNSIIISRLASQKQENLESNRWHEFLLITKNRFIFGSNRTGSTQTQVTHSITSIEYYVIITFASLSLICDYLHWTTPTSYLFIFYNRQAI